MTLHSSEPMTSLKYFTIHDWVMAQRELSRGSFSRLKRTAHAARVPIPFVVRGHNTMPVITFEFPLERATRLARIEDVAALKKFQKDIDEWGRKVVHELRISVSSIPHFGPSKGHLPGAGLYESLDYYVKNDDEYHAEPVRIGFRFARHGVHLHFGAGKGYGGNVGSRWIDRYGIEKSTDPRSLGRAGTGARSPQNWFNPVLERNMKALADICADYCAEMIVNSDFLYLA